MWLESVVTQRSSIVKNVGCFRRNLFVGLWVCQHDNVRTSKHRMMKRGGRCIAQKSRPSSNLGFIAPSSGFATPKMWRFAESRCVMLNANKAMRAGVTSHRTQCLDSTCLQLQYWENQRRLSSFYPKTCMIAVHRALLSMCNNNNNNNDNNNLIIQRHCVSATAPLATRLHSP